HLALNMRFQPDLLLKENLGQRLKGVGRLFLLLAEKLLDGVAHTVGFGCGLGLRLDPKPSIPAVCIANVFHASSNIPYDALGREPSAASAALSAEDNMPARPSPRP